MNIFYNDQEIIVSTQYYTMQIIRSKFKYRFLNNQNEIIIDYHPKTGLKYTTPNGYEIFETNRVEIVKEEDQSLTLKAMNTNKDSIIITIYFFLRYVNFDVIPTKKGKYIFEFCTASSNYAYGLGDYGSHADDINTIGKDNRIMTRDKANIIGIKRDDMQNLGSCKRVISNFVVFSQLDFAEVLFTNLGKRVNITQSENILGLNGVNEVKGMYYFFGDMKTIYQEYKIVRNQLGYHDKCPNYEMFEVGWESYGALGWNAYQESIIESIEGYLKRGYKLRWAVIGSGFWKGDRKKPHQGVTTAFGLWDDIGEENRTDGMPNPRFPDVCALKGFLKKHQIKLILGLRNHFKAPIEVGGYHHLQNDGPFLQEGVDKGYFMKNEDGSIYEITNHQFPAGTIYMLDSDNEEALDWYINQCELWEADGFKEDAMIYQLTHSDHKWNRINERLSDRGKCVIVRNTAYSSPGDIVRINDSYYGDGEDYHHDPDRMPINLLNIAASGFANTYPDIVGGTPTESIDNPIYQKYIVRNALFSSLCPAVSVGRRAWDMKNEKYERIVKRAIDFHSSLVPYIYSAAIKSYLTGYPYTMTPLHIAYNHDYNTYDLISREKRQYEWMLGESILVHPLFGNDFNVVDCRDVYLPEGTWIDFETREEFIGPTTLTHYPHPVEHLPIFIGGKGILVMEEENKLKVRVYKIMKDGEYVHYGKNGVSSRIQLENITFYKPITVLNININKEIDYQLNQNVLEFELVEGINYLVSEEK